MQQALLAIKIKDLKRKNAKTQKRKSAKTLTQRSTLSASHKLAKPNTVDSVTKPATYGAL